MVKVQPSLGDQFCSGADKGKSALAEPKGHDDPLGQTEVVLCVQWSVGDIDSESHWDAWKSSSER
jgi:hypothetical protein